MTMGDRLTTSYGIYRGESHGTEEIGKQSAVPRFPIQLKTSDANSGMTGFEVASILTSV